MFMPCHAMPCPRYARDSLTPCLLARGTICYNVRMVSSPIHIEDIEPHGADAWVLTRTVQYNGTLGGDGSFVCTLCTYCTCCMEERRDVKPRDYCTLLKGTRQLAESM